MIQYHLIVSGKVQGVGFRYFVQMKAMHYDVTGWVKNLENGSVEIVASADKEALLSFIKEIKKGNLFISVEHLDIREEIPSRFASFRIR
ncbi:acylphosphatase [Niallia sp. NCCP-28]|uniref:acylphosphatase n=1 Tax=Niallia sp. NCCP-28 TaxID=2934712 RepID=UPI00208BA175|nr:acylphosphatase [Niallia sp. NCCP-28]GKU84426.1 acylphosphatase [Niallia sp. NCCP-28]